MPYCSKALLRKQLPLTSQSQGERRIVDGLKAIRAAYAVCFTIATSSGDKTAAHSPNEELYDDLFPVGPLQLDLDLQTLSQTGSASDTLERNATTRNGAVTSAVPSAALYARRPAHFDWP